MWTGKKEASADGSVESARSNGQERPSKRERPEAIKVMRDPEEAEAMTEEEGEDEGGRNGPKEGVREAADEELEASMEAKDQEEDLMNLSAGSDIKAPGIVASTGEEGWDLANEGEREAVKSRAQVAKAIMPVGSPVDCVLRDLGTPNQQMTVEMEAQ